MTDISNTFALSSAGMKIVLSEAFPDSTYGAVPVTEQQSALFAYYALDAEALAEVPGALEAFLEIQRSRWV